MKELYSSILGSIIVSDDYKLPVATIKDIIIDPEKAKIVAIVVDQKRNIVVAAIDIISWTNYLQIKEISAFIDASEVVRVKDVVEKDIPIIGNQVFTENGKYLGKVFDLLLDKSKLKLVKIYTHKSFLGLISLEKRIIPIKDIIKIEKDKILIKDDLIKLKDMQPKKLKNLTT